MIIICHSCSARYKVKDDLVADGPKRTKCKNCGAVMLIIPPPEGVEPNTEVLTRDIESQAPAGQQPPQATRPAAESPPPAEASPVADEAETSAETGEPAVREPGTESEPAETEAEPVGEAPGEPEKEQPEVSTEEKKEEKPEESDPLAKMEKRRQQMEDEISGRLHKAALETLEFSDLEIIAKKINKIEENPDYRPEKEEQIFTCIECKSVYSLFPEDPRTCSNCPGDAPLIRSADILKQYSMFRRM